MRTAVFEERDAALVLVAEDETPAFHCYSDDDVLKACDHADRLGLERIRVLIHPAPRRTS